METMDESELRERTRRLLAEVDPDAAGVSQFDFRGAQFDHGLAWVHFPEGLGGLGLSRGAQRLVADELREQVRTPLPGDLQVNPRRVGSRILDQGPEIGFEIRVEKVLRRQVHVHREVAAITEPYWPLSRISLALAYSGQNRTQ